MKCIVSVRGYQEPRLSAISAVAEQAGAVCLCIAITGVVARFWLPERVRAPAVSAPARRLILTPRPGRCRKSDGILPAEASRRDQLMSLSADAGHRIPVDIAVQPDPIQPRGPTPNAYPGDS
jgi:hypothetical protein